MHTIYAMLKILKIDEADPLLWQLSFTDTEVDKILQRREAQLLKNQNAAQQWQQQYASIET